MPVVIPVAGLAVPMYVTIRPSGLPAGGPGMTQVDAPAAQSLDGLTDWPASASVLLAGEPDVRESWGRFMNEEHAKPYSEANVTVDGDDFSKKGTRLAYVNPWVALQAGMALMDNAPTIASNPIETRAAQSADQLLFAALGVDSSGDVAGWKQG